MRWWPRALIEVFVWVLPALVILGGFWTARAFRGQQKGTPKGPTLMLNRGLLPVAALLLILSMPWWPGELFPSILLPLAIMGGIWAARLARNKKRAEPLRPCPWFTLVAPASSVPHGALSFHLDAQE